MWSFLDYSSLGYVLATSGLLYFSYKYIEGGFLVIYNLYKYKQDKKYEAVKITRKVLAVPYKYQHHDYYALLPIKSSKQFTVLNVYEEKLDIIGSTITDSSDDKIIDIDVTEDIHRYLGHNGDFSGCNITPLTLGYYNLKFKLMLNNGDVKTIFFKGNEIIAFDKHD